MGTECPCTAAELADVLNVSVRTIKMYVKEINTLAHHKVVLSSNKGYTALKISDLSFLDEPQAFCDELCGTFRLYH